jgi:hypothetical protein
VTAVVGDYLDRDGFARGHGSRKWGRTVEVTPGDGVNGGLKVVIGRTVFSSGDGRLVLISISMEGMHVSTCP